MRRRRAAVVRCGPVGASVKRQTAAGSQHGTTGLSHTYSRPDDPDHLRSGHDVYVIGDNAFTPWSGLAQTALHDGIFVAQHILGESKKKYVAKLPPVVVPVGDNWAIFEYKKIRFGGWLGAKIRSAADFVGYSDILPFGQALGVWRAQKVKEEFYLTAASKAQSIVETK